MKNWKHHLNWNNFFLLKHHLNWYEGININEMRTQVGSSLYIAHNCQPNQLELSKGWIIELGLNIDSRCWGCKYQTKSNIETYSSSVFIVFWSDSSHLPLHLFNILSIFLILFHVFLLLLVTLVYLAHGSAKWW